MFKSLMQKPPPFPCPKTFWFSQTLKTSNLSLSFFCLFFKFLALLLMIPYTILLHFAKFLKFKHNFFLEKKDCICGYMDRLVLLRHEIWNCKLRKVRDLRFAIRYLPLTTCCRALFVNEDLQVDKPRRIKKKLCFYFFKKERKKQRKQNSKSILTFLFITYKGSSLNCIFFLFFSLFLFFCFVLF